MTFSVRAAQSLTPQNLSGDSNSHAKIACLRWFLFEGDYHTGMLQRLKGRTLQQGPMHRAWVGFTSLDRMCSGITAPLRFVHTECLLKLHHLLEDESAQ